MEFRNWLEETKPEILKFGQDLALQPNTPILVSFDFDGTLTKWNQGPHGWYETPFIPVIRRLKNWSAKGHHCVITTHRTKELEGNPVFANSDRVKMQIKDLVADDVLPLSGNDIVFTHMGDKGQTLTAIIQKLNLPAAIHYDDENKNLESVANAGHTAVKVDPGPAPPKFVVAGDGQQPNSASILPAKTECVCIYFAPYTVK